jgi:hypothetical protein
LSIAVLALTVLTAGPGRAAVAAEALTASGTNLLINPNFDAGVTGWQMSDGTGWDAGRDADGNPNSGSVRLSVVNETLNTDSAVSQCVPISPGTYRLSGKVFAPTGSYNAESIAELIVFWEESATCGNAGALPNATTPAIHPATTQNSWVSVTTGLVVPPAATRSALIVPIEGSGGPGSLTTNFDDLVFEAVFGTCVESPTTLCIDDSPGDHRFAIGASFATLEGGGQSGSGAAIPLASLGVARGGVFAFFGADNPELLVKVLNACSLNQQYWVFFAAVTNVGFTVTVTDTISGQQRVYHNPDLHAAAPVQDTSALPCS